MKHIKIFELFESEDEKKHPLYFRMKEVSNKLIKMFFDNDDRVGEEMSCDNNKIEYEFYFDEIPTKNIVSCKKFVKNYTRFYLDLNVHNEPYAVLFIELSLEQFEELEEKLEIEESTKKYNL